MDELVPHMDEWTTISVEIYCCINLDYFRKHYPYNYEFDHNLPPEEWKKIPNPEYEPDIKPNDWPENCKRELGIRCLECEYVGYTEYDTEDE